MFKSGWFTIIVSPYEKKTHLYRLYAQHGKPPTSITNHDLSPEICPFISFSQFALHFFGLCFGIGQHLRKPMWDPMPTRETWQVCLCAQWWVLGHQIFRKVVFETTFSDMVIKQWIQFLWCDFSHSCTSMSSVSSNRFPCELDNRSNNLQSKVKHLVNLGKWFPVISMSLHVSQWLSWWNSAPFSQTISDLRLLRHWLFVQQLQGLGVVGDLDWCFWKKQKPGR